MVWVYALIISFLGGHPGFSEGNVQGKLATIDHDRIILSSAAFDRARTLIEARREQYQQDLIQKEKQLRELETFLRENEKTITPEEFLKKRRDFDKAVEATQKNVADRRRFLDDIFYKFRAKVVDMAMEIIQKLCAERSIVMVIPKSQIIYAIETLEITDEVLKRLNQRLPAESIAIDLDKLDGK